MNQNRPLSPDLRHRRRKLSVFLALAYTGLAGVMAWVAWMVTR